MKDLATATNVSTTDVATAVTGEVTSKEKKMKTELQQICNGCHATRHPFFYVVLSFGVGAGRLPLTHNPTRPTHPPPSPSSSVPRR